MLSVKQNVVNATISHDLFRSADGEPISFFLRPGPVKCKLQPLITSGGGLMCSVQRPGSILLISQEETDHIPPSTAHWYVSTSYIYDCIERGKQLNLADYRVNPKDAPRQSARLQGKIAASGGRTAYTPEEDAAILSYVKNHMSDVGGNQLWKTMQGHNVTGHSWQSMKYRFKILAKKLEEEKVKEEKEEEEEEEEKEEEEITKKQNEEDNEVIDDPKSPTEDPSSPQTHSPEDPRSETAQMDPQLTPAETSTPQNAEAETSRMAPPEDPPVEDLPPPPSRTEPQAAEPQTSQAPLEQNMPEETQQAPPLNPAPLEPTDNQEGEAPPPPKLEQQQRRPRRKLLLEASSSSSSSSSSPEPYGKKLRSSRFCQSESTSSQSAKETEAGGGNPRTAAAGPEPAERARGESAAAESQDEETNPSPRNEGKNEEKKKRALGLLEIATHEFEEDSEVSEEEAAVFQTCPETSAEQPPSTAAAPPPSDTAPDQVSTQSSPEPMEVEESQPTQSLRTDNVAETGAVKPQPSNPESETPESEAPEPAAPKALLREAPAAASRPHLFIFDSESQEDDSQSLLRGGDGVVSRPPADRDAALSLTQVQVEEDVQQIKELMKQTRQDLVSVTKALLKTSGDVSAALSLLLNPSSSSGPLWTRRDDLLLGTDPVCRQKLQEKYGERELAKRIVFLELDK